ncbi:unnamed protein product [Rotaria sp. Silwood1]|nr:unnamed protein product [Rotaria sp. Silwood1]
MTDALGEKAVGQNDSWLLLAIHHRSEQSSREVKLDSFSAETLAAWGLEHAAELEYRVELARRIAQTFGNADTVLIFDDIDLVLPELERLKSKGIRGCDRSLLPALWFSAGFRRGGKVIVYAPPNPVEMKNYVELKMVLEQRLGRVVPIQILYETEEGKKK